MSKDETAKPEIDSKNPSPPEAPRQRPSLGRVVIFKDVRGREYAALIARVHEDDRVDVAFFRPEADHAHDIPHSAKGPKPGHWHWPPRS